MKSEFQIERERKAMARGRLLKTWTTLSTAVEDPTMTIGELKKHERALMDARAIAAEWKLDCEAIVAEAEALV